MSADLRLATIYVMPLGGRDIEEVLEALERNKRYLRGEIARHVNLKFAPDIRFHADERFAEAERIEKLLRTPAVQRDLKRDEGENERNESTRPALSPPPLAADGSDELPAKHEKASSSSAARSATCTAGSCSTRRSA